MSSTPDAAKPLRFDVVSIRPSGDARTRHMDVLPDGYEAIGMPLEVTLDLAYVPAPYFKHLDEVKGAPAWVAEEKYDVRVKVAPADAARWQSLNQNMMRTAPVLQGMLQQVLAERCKLRIHSTEAMTDGFALHIRAKSPALVEDASLPVGDQGMELLDGARAIYVKQNGEQIYTFYNTSMAVLANFLTISSQHPVADRTGLQGRYRFVLRRVPDVAAGQDAGPQVDTPVPWDLRSLGIKVDGEKVKSKIWVVDSMERPSSN